jgi:hypothetical protein
MSKQIILAVFASLILAAPIIQAGPNCDIRPNHPSCEPTTSDPGPVYKITFSNIATGTEAIPGIYTTPGTLTGDESGLNANSNGPNEVILILNDGSAGSFIREFFLDQDGNSSADSCFPQGHELRGSIQLADNSQSGGDPARVGYIWVSGFSLSGEAVPYQIDLFDMIGGWTGDFLPAPGGSATRTVTHWELKASKKRFKDVCATGGLVEQVSNQTSVAVGAVSTNPWYE